MPEFRKMAVEMKFVVTREGKEIGVFATQQEAEAFEAVTDRSEKLAVVLTATSHEHNLDMEAVQRVARALAAREKDLLAIFASSAKAKIKSAKGPRKTAPKKLKTTASPRPETEAA
jgi:dsDNA-binding SOS-regulon protein